jgi:hypothetical protein
MMADEGEKAGRSDMRLMQVLFLQIEAAKGLESVQKGIDALVKENVRIITRFSGVFCCGC